MQHEMAQHYQLSEMGISETCLLTAACWLRRETVIYVSLTSSE